MKTHTTERNAAKSLPPGTSKRLAALSDKLSTPPEELAEMFLSAALDAIESTLESKGGIVLPLTLFTDDQGHIIRLQPTAEQLEAYGRAAHEKGAGFSRWIMSTLDTAAANTGGKA